MREYIDCLQGLSHDLADIGCTIDDAELAETILNGLPDKFEPILLGIWSSSGGQLTTALVKERLLPLDSKSSESRDSALASKSFVPVCHNCNQEGHIKPRCPRLKKKKKPQGQVGAQGHSGSQGQAPSRGQDNLQGHSNRVGGGPTARSNFVLTAALGAQVFSESEWIVDSGSTDHLCNNESEFRDLKSTVTREIYVANNGKINSDAQGNIQLNFVVGTGTIGGALYVPEVGVNLLSVSRITEQGHKVVFEKSLLIVMLI